MSARRQSSRPALDRYTFPIAIYVLAGDGRVLEGEAHIVGNKKIEVAIAVVVEETASCSPARLVVPQAGGLGYVSKRSIAVVAVETILTKIGAEDVLESVVVVVADADAGCPAHSFQSGLLRHIRKRSVAVVFVEAIRGAGRIAIQTRAGQQKNIDPTVVVIVDEGAATTGSLQNVFFAFDSAVDHRSVQSRGSCDIDEVCIERTPRGRRSRHRLDSVRGNALSEEAWSGRQGPPNRRRVVENRDG